MPFLHNLILLMMMGGNRDGFLLLKMVEISVTLRVGIGVISKELINSFGVNRLN